MVSSLLGPWRESGRRESHPQSGRGEYGPTLRHCLSFADPRNQAARAVASRRVPGARSCQGACGLSPPDQKARPGGCLPSAPSAQPQHSWQPGHTPRGRGWTPLAVRGRGRSPLASRWPCAAHRLACSSLQKPVRALTPTRFFSAACLLPHRSRVGVSVPVSRG